MQINSVTDQCNKNFNNLCHIHFFPVKKYVWNDPLIPKISWNVYSTPSLIRPSLLYWTSYFIRGVTILVVFYYLDASEICSDKKGNTVDMCMYIY